MGLEAGEEGPENEQETRVFFAIRLGTAYEFRVAEKFAISPGLFFDIIGQSKNSWVWGIAFGYNF